MNTIKMPTRQKQLPQSSCQLYTKRSLLLFVVMILMIMMTNSCVAGTSASEDIERRNAQTVVHLRGLMSNQEQYYIDDNDNARNIRQLPTIETAKHQHYERHRSIKEETHNNNHDDTPQETTSLSITFQIITSAILSLLILFQLLLLLSFLRQRTKRVLEFAQPLIICIFLMCSIITTATCYLYIYSSSSWTCAIREPIMFLSVSFMGATVGGRAWRIITLCTTLLSVGRNNNKNGEGGVSNGSGASRVERVRQSILRILRVLSGCECNPILVMKQQQQQRNGGAGRGKPIRVQITSLQMMRAIVVMILPQLLWQIVLVSVPAMRSTLKQTSYTHTLEYNDHTTTVQLSQCQSSVGFWPNYISILLTLLPYAIAYLLNVRPKSELDQLPEIIDERDHLKQSFSICANVLVVAAPMIGLTYKTNPAATAYGAICAVLALPLACCYHIAYVKLYSTKSNMQQQTTRTRAMTAGGTSPSPLSGGDAADGGRSSAAAAVRMAEMYSRIGRVEETVQLVDETLGVFRKGNNVGNLGNLGIANDGRQEVACGFTTNDLKALDGDELQMIIQLLRLKGNALIKLEGPTGFAMSAKLNIDALKIFEHCPAADKMKDISLIFPIYNIVGIQLKGGVIDQDDKCSLEMELAVRFCHEAQLQAYHYARSLANVAEIYGRMGILDKAFNYFDIMKAVYMKQDHPKLLLDTYAVDRCAVSFASSALWYLQMGQVDNAIEACDYVIKHILPHYDEKDIIGLYHIFIQIIRVLKWNGYVDKAREAYNKFMPDAASNHFAVKTIHKPMGLVLQICEGSTYEYDVKNMQEDIEMVLAFDMDDMTDNNFTCDGWSMKSLAAELCMLFARRLDAGNGVRERLIDRGIMMATVAQQRVKASNGMVKHILAYQANKEIHKALLLLANEEVDIDRDIIYDAGTRDSNRAVIGRESLICDIKSSTNYRSSSTLANKFSVKDGTSNTNGSATMSNGSGSGAGSSAPKSIPPPLALISTRKRSVLFSQVSSFGSNGSVKKKTSYHSHESIKEESSHSFGSSSQKLRESAIDVEGEDALGAADAVV